MQEVRFYHLTQTPLEATLPGILEKSLQRGWRVLVQCGSGQSVAFLDDRLWLGRNDSFLPHGVAVKEFASEQPILLSETAENQNNADVLMLVDRAQNTADVMKQFNLTCLFFDGNNHDALAAAREDWKKVTDTDLKAVYWAQDDNGQWDKKAESGD